jgi:asparagine N-glycosylation enzyme membrane subunit Stt3
MPGLSGTRRHFTMNILLIVVIVIAVALAITGGLVSSLQFLLWVGIVLAVIAVIAWIVRSMSGRRT